MRRSFCSRIPSSMTTGGRPMNPVDHVLEELHRLLSENPEVASAALIALAVERGFVTERTAKAWVRSLDLNDFEQTKAMLAREVDRAGHISVVVDLMRSGRRIERRTRILLDSSSGS
jgi:hypothetical protein